MELSDSLISQFVKATQDKKETKKESIVYGTVVNDNGINKVQIDGNGPDQLTPVSNAATSEPGDRVTVMIKNHKAVVTGNLTSPSVGTGYVDRFDTVLADKISSKEFYAETAKIDGLIADNAIIRGRLDVSDIKVANIEADNVEINKALTANTADINTLNTSKLDAGVAEATYAKIGDLSAATADIRTLMFGSASGDTIQTSFANTVIGQLGDAQIKSAMIESVSADKITAGDIITNNVRVMSEDGKLLISDETLQISDNNRVRVQVGKDAAGDYSINVWDQNGNLMFSKGGITDAAIKDAIIRNDMVSDTANISASKLDIDSLFSEINGSTNTIKSSQVYLDSEKQTLDIAFKALVSEVLDNGAIVSSQGTSIEVLQGYIATKIWQQDIDTAKNELSTRYSTLEQTVDGFKTTVTETYATKTYVDDVEIGGRNLYKNSKGPFTLSQSTSDYNYFGFACDMELNGTYTISADVEPTVGSFTQVSILPYPGGVQKICTIPENGRVSYAFTKTKDTIERVLIYAGVAGSTNGNGLIIRNVKIEKGDKATDWTPAPEDVDTEITNLGSRISSAETSITQLSNKITANVSETTNLGTRTTTLEQTSTGLTTRITNAEKDIINAGKTATNYLNFTSGGLVVGDLTVSTLGKNALIDNEGFKVRSGTTVNSFFGADIVELAKNNQSATISMLNGTFKIYYSSDISEAGLGIYGKTSTGEERLAFQPVNENDNLTVGWGGYNAKKNSTNIYGHNLKLIAGNDMSIENDHWKVNIDGNLFAKASDSSFVELIGLSSDNNTAIGHGGYTNSLGKTNIYGNKINHIVNTSRGSATYKPYYEAGDSVEIEWYGAGFISSSSKIVYFTIPLAKPVIGGTTPNVSVSAHSSDNGLRVRQGGNYVFGATSSTHIAAASYKAAVSGEGNLVRIEATMSNDTNASNNAPCGIDARIKLSFS